MFQVPKNIQRKNLRSMNRKMKQSVMGYTQVGPQSNICSPDTYLEVKGSASTVWTWNHKGIETAIMQAISHSLKPLSLHCLSMHEIKACPPSTYPPISFLPLCLSLFPTLPADPNPGGLTILLISSINPKTPTFFAHKLAGGGRGRGRVCFFPWKVTSVRLDSYGGWRCQSNVYVEYSPGKLGNQMDLQWLAGLLISMAPGNAFPMMLLWVWVFFVYCCFFLFFYFFKDPV